jgi:copper transporter 1
MSRCLERRNVTYLSFYTSILWIYLCASRARARRRPHYPVQPTPTNPATYLFHIMEMSGMSMASTTMASTTSMIPSVMSMAPTSEMFAGSMNSGMTMSMADMVMVFFTSANTPLYTSAWTPTTAGQYAGTCIFLVILPIICRALLVLRCRFPAWMARNDTYDKAQPLQHPRDDIDECKQQLQTIKRPWSINESLLRGVLDTVLAGVGYLL